MKMAETNGDLADVLAAVPRLTAKELNTVSEAIEAARLEHSTTGRQALLAEFQQKAAALGLSLDELMKQPMTTKGKSGKATKKVTPKYRAPNGDEWTGRGRPPRWIVMLEAEGKRREDYLINKG
jgi:DNA-binding protein H-NS